MKQIRKAVGQQLRYLGRNLKTIEKLLGEKSEGLQLLQKQEYKDYLVIQEIYRQQKQMYDRQDHHCEDRIVSIHQPHIRPIVRGKQGKTVEFGSKILAGITDDGYALITRMDWNAYNEGGYVIESVEQHKKTYGYYPAVVIADRIFITRANRKALEGLGIRLCGKNLEQRVRIEGKFGQGKNGYELNKIRMRKSSTSESMVAMIFFVMNLVRYAKKVLLWPFLQIGKIMEILLFEYASDGFAYQKIR